MNMYITALEPAPATLGPQAEGCLSPEPEAAGTANKIAPISRQIWDAKYRLKADDGTPIDVTIEDSWRRVALALAAAENDPEQWEVPFYQVLEDFRFLPAGRILAGAGTGRRVTLFNCFVMGNVEDDLGSIFSHLREAALTMLRVAASATTSLRSGPKARRSEASAPMLRGHCPLWMSGTRCAVRSCPPAPAAAP